MHIQIPDFSLVLMMGPSGSGKTTFARRHFSPTQVISSDNCRAMVSDDPASHQATKDAFRLVHHITGARLRNRRLTVIDATNLQPEHRAPLVQLARDNDCPVVTIVMNTPLQDCIERNEARTDRQVPEQVVKNQHRRLRFNIRQTKKEGIRRQHIIATQEDNELAIVDLTRLRLNRPDLSGPFDIIGDVHGCYDELIALLTQLGYKTGSPAGTTDNKVDSNNRAVPRHPRGRQAIFVGDLVDRGPASDRVLELVMDMTQAGTALCVAGNHENKLMRSMKGNPVQISHGLQQTMEQLDARTPEFREKVLHFISRLDEHYLLDEGRLAVAHAGVLERYQGRVSRRIKDFCLYGQTTGETDEWGLPVRQDWALEYRGRTVVVYGHTPVSQPRWTNETINVDTGCVFGGSLTALRYPERELVSVPALRTYYEPAKPISSPQPEKEDSPPKDNRQSLHIADVTGRMSVSTSTGGRINVPDTQSAAALEPMSRFAVDPRFLIYLPPTIAPCMTSQLPDILEHPAQAFEQYRADGLQQVICEEKHMGSRGIIVLGKDRKSVRDRFGIDTPNAGAAYSRTGRQFFINPELEATFFQRARKAAAEAGLWEELETDWLLLDAEVMPWSLKSQPLIRYTYAPTGAAAVNTLQRADILLAEAGRRGVDTRELNSLTHQRLVAAAMYREAYRHYCWKAESLDDVRVAPFHFLAAESGLLTGNDHHWHMQQAMKLADTDPGLFQKTRYRIVDLDNQASEQEAVNWWDKMTSGGGEGMVVKPMDFIPAGKHDRIQPAVKVRGVEYLRIIYGPEYNLPANMERIKPRSLRKKRSMALRESALGLEGLKRFIEREPLSQVHQCAFAVLALETEPIDPRL